MRNWRLTLLAAVAVLGLQACDQSPPQTSVQPPQASLPDDTVLRDSQPAHPPQVAGTPPATGETPSPSPQTNVMGAPAEPSAAQAPAAPAPSAQDPAAQPAAGQGTAAMTELWQFLPPPGTQSPAAPANSAAPAAPAAAASAPETTSGATPPSQDVASANVPAVRNPGDPQGAQRLAQRQLLVPVVGIEPASLKDEYDLSRGNRRHEAIDILAPSGTPVVAVDDGRIAKLFTSKPGGLTIYQYDPQSQLAYYYAHLQRYADGLREGMDVHRGDLIGYVGTTGNARNTPHLHFGVFRLGSPPKWWQGEAVNPYPALARAEPSQLVASR
jgi:murein DD-endopeptidase MepM/ murein hydrolase activator NlpD